jgi:hypothetical protein
MQRPWYEFGISVSCIFNTLFIIIEPKGFVYSDFSEVDADSIYFRYYWWEYTQITINFFFFLEALLEMIMVGPRKAYVRNWRLWPETLCQVLNTYACYDFFKDFFEQEKIGELIFRKKIFETIIIIRLLKVFGVITEI